MNVAIIPARGGSRRIPRKNVRLFHGKPIIAYSIEAARESGLFEKIVVSTEDVAIAAVAKAYGAKIHNRRRALADDITGTQEVVKAALEWWISCGNTQVPTFACCIYPCAPLITPDDLREAYRIAYEEPYNYVYAEGQFYFGVESRFRLEPNEFSYSKRLENERFIDINTESDWQRAEQMYAALHQVPA